MTTKKLFPIVWLSFIAATPANAVDLYAVTDLGSLGGTNSSAYGINAKGQVVGESEVALGSNITHAFLYDAAGLHDLSAFGSTGSVAFGINTNSQIIGCTDCQSAAGSKAFLYDGINGRLVALGAPGSLGYAINDAGQAAGKYILQGTDSHAFFYALSTGVKDLGTLGGSYSAATNINASGQVVGESGASPGNASIHAFSYTNAGLSDLGTLGGLNSSAWGINNNGQIVGTSNYTASSNNTHAFLADSSGLHDLGTLGGNSSWAYAINSGGQVVGQADIGGSSASHAFLYESGVLRDLNNLLSSNPGGWTLTYAGGINDAGQIIANGVNSAGATHAIFLSPVRNLVKINCLFNWAETNYPSLFSPSNRPTEFAYVYTYRYYSGSRSYLGVSSTDNHVYYLGADGNMVDEGLLANWLAQSGCQ